MQDASRSPFAAIFAPRPISTALWSAPAVEVFEYATGTGLAKVPSRSIAFAGIDADVWVRSVAASLDALLAADDVEAGLAALDRLAGTTRRTDVLTQRAYPNAVW